MIATGAADGSRFAVRRPTFSTDHLKATDGNHCFAVRCVRPLKSLSASFQVWSELILIVFVFCTDCSRDLMSSSVGISQWIALSFNVSVFLMAMQDPSENAANAKTSFQIASMDMAGNVVVWTVVEKQVCRISMCCF